ncbi:MAG: hypothetical protein KatS3mg131_0649 [Candidatus Tectimicrobiota bacterium]|nr:MAG: hypothetical protein KatS3mg131_0649 [Candidatus Tectomicrobia bacterium]
MAKLQVFDPTTEVKERPLVFAPRPDSLRNARIGLVENTKFNSDKLLLKIAAILEQEYGARGHVLRRKRNASVPVDAETLQELKATCDVVIAGIGD